MSRMAAFKETCSNPTHNVATMLNTALKEQVSRNTKVIKSLLKCVAFCGKQGIFSTVTEMIPLPQILTTLETLESLFGLRLKMMMCCVPTWKQLLGMLFYTSKTIQNEMISALGSSIQEIKAGNFHSILADEVTNCTWNNFQLR